MAYATIPYCFINRQNRNNIYNVFCNIVFSQRVDNSGITELLSSILAIDVKSQLFRRYQRRKICHHLEILNLTGPHSVAFYF
jgi:hypothetical protein